MTVTTTSRKQEFAGGQSALTYTFYSLPSHATYIKVTVKEIATDAETDLVYTTGYTVAQESDGVGGVVTVSPTYSTAYTYTVWRDTVQTQSSDYDDYNQFPADTLEKDLDRLMCLSQEAGEDDDRTLKHGITVSASTTLPAPADGKILQWSGTAGTMVNVAHDSASLAAAVTAATNAATTASTAATTASTAAVVAVSASSVAVTASVTAVAAAATIPSPSAGAARDYLRINAGQTAYEQVTPTTEPAFSVHPASSQDNIATGDVTVIWGTEIFDQGSNFAANTFTAPVTGKYQFNVMLVVNNIDTVGSSYSVVITTSNRGYSFTMVPGQFAADVSTWAFAHSVLADMDANDTCYIKITQAVGTAQSDIQTTSWFSGVLLIS